MLHRDVHRRNAHRRIIAFTGASRRSRRRRSAQDVIAITETGYENLSAFAPEDIENVERIMAGGKLTIPGKGGR
jgi:hypothetical protein